EGTVYPALHRLEQAGLLASSWITPAGGRRRRVYTLTDDGRNALTKRRDVWDRFARAVQALVGGGRSWPA
ncbi:helix-turn-helix transcriptional regulator, partial [Acinetobacter baumannii]